MKYGDSRLPARFWKKVACDRDDGCWLWAAGLQTDGYGCFWWDELRQLAHRVAYIVLVGAVPAGLELDHLCRNRRCVNPSHLDAVTHAENISRGRTGAVNRRKTSCPAGHQYDAVNTYTSKGGGRLCLACNRIRSREYQRRLRSQEVR